MIAFYVRSWLIGMYILLKWAGLLMQVVVTIQRGNQLKKGVQ